MKKSTKAVIMLLTVVTMVTVLSGCDMFKKTNDGQVDLKWYMGLTYEDSNQNDIEYKTKVGSQVMAVALENDYAKEYAILKDVDAYINLDVVKENIDKRFYWDKKDKRILFTNATTNYYIDKKDTVLHGGDADEDLGYVAFITEKKKCYVNTKFVQKFADCKINITKKSGKAPGIVSFDYTSTTKKTFTIDSDTQMRTKGDYQNLIVTDIKEGTKVTAIEQGKNWSKVKTESGYIGYVPTKELTNEENKKITYKNDDDEYTHITMDKLVSLAWTPVYNQTANNNLEGLIANTKGVNVVSPTWFSLADRNGNLSTLADLSYVEKAHKAGMQVWALYNDFSSAKITKKVLANTELRTKLVNNIIYYAKSYELDGINIDFEHINTKMIDSYLQFLRELSVQCRKEQLVLSIDNYSPSQWSGYYDREQQLKLADYLIIMNYDEHTSASTEAGSVSSLSYAEKSIQDTIKQAKDASRIINGVPFYTRIWKETPQADGDGTGTLIEDSANGNYYLSCESAGMSTAEKTYKDAGVKPTYDKTTGQNYVTYSKGKSTYSIWLEDATSMKARMELMKKYKLAGSAYWSLGQENDSIWDTIGSYFE